MVGWFWFFVFVVVVTFDRIEGWLGMDLAGDGLGLGGGIGNGVGGGDRVDASPEAVGLSNLQKKAEKYLLS